MDAVAAKTTAWAVGNTRAHGHTNTTASVLSVIHGNTCTRSRRHIDARTDGHTGAWLHGDADAWSHRRVGTGTTTDTTRIRIRMYARERHWHQTRQAKHDLNDVVVIDAW